MFHAYPPFTKLLPAALLAGMFSISPASAVEVYFFKGAGDFSFINKDLHFSGGLARMADELNKEGIHAEIRRFGSTADALRTIRARRPESVAFVGHSMGALASMNMANRMKELGVRVAYVGTIDIPGPIGKAGKNVEWAENYFSVFPVYGKLTNVSRHPKAKNIYVFGQIHTTMDDSKKVRDGVLAAIREIDRAERGAIEAPVEQLMVKNEVPVREPVVLAQVQPRKRMLKIDEDPKASWDNDALSDRMMLTRKAVAAQSVAIARAKPRKRLLKIDEVDPDAPDGAVAVSSSDSQFASTAPVNSYAEVDAPQTYPNASTSALAPVNLLAAPRANKRRKVAVSRPRLDMTHTGSVKRAKANRTIDISNLTRRGKRMIGKVSAFFARQRRALKSRLN